MQGISLSTDFVSTNASQYVHSFDSVSSRFECLLSDTSRHGNVTVFVLGSSMPGFVNLAQAVPGCGTTDNVSINSSQTCNISSVTLSLFGGSNSKTGSFSLPDTTYQTNLFNDSFSCPQSGDVPAFDGGISVDLKSTVTGSLNYAVAYKSFLSVPDPTSLSLTVGFDAALDGTLSLNTNLVVRPPKPRPSAEAHLLFVGSTGQPYHRRYHPVFGRIA